MCCMVQVEAEGEVATAFTLARVMSNIPLTRGGPASVVIFDIHALQVRLAASSLLLQCIARCISFWLVYLEIPVQ